MMDAQQVKNIIEACLLVAGKAMSLRQLDDLFEGDENRPDKDTIKATIEELQSDYEGRGIELVQVASGYRLQSRTEVSEWVARLFPEKPPRYSRALLETLVLVAYRQPITRGEIEEIRGVAVSSNIVKTLQERQWVKEVGFKDVPGKPALLGTTKHFLDYFNLKRLDDLPPLSEIKNLDEMDAALMEAAGIAPTQESAAANDGEMPDDDENENAVNQSESKPDDSAAGHEQAEAKTDVDADKQHNDSIDTSGDDADKQRASGTSERVVGTDNSDGPVTFAGIVSDLLLLEQLPPSDAETETEILAETTISTDEEELAETHTDAPADADANTDANADVHTDVHTEEPIANHAENDEELANKSHLDVHLEDSAEVLDETPTQNRDEQQKLYSRISDFAQEHQRDLEARDELESQQQTRYSKNEGNETANDGSKSDEGGDSTEAELVTSETRVIESSSLVDSLGDSIDLSSSSIDVLSDTFTGDVPDAGETLH